MHKNWFFSLFVIGVLVVANGCRVNSTEIVNPGSTEQPKAVVLPPATPLPTASITPMLSPTPSSTHLAKLDPGDQWKTFSQIEVDLETVVRGGYSKLCLFDLDSIWGYPDSRYIPLLKKYVDSGIEITIYVQEVEPSQQTLNAVQSIGATSVIVYDKNLSALFKNAGMKTFWWSAAAYPPNHKDQPQYLGWPDLRSEQVRRDIADWAVQIPKEVDGGLSLDYIRWNAVGNERTAEQVTDLVQRIRSNWNAMGKGTVSAAVYPYLGAGPNNGGALSVGQKWDEWLRKGLIDFVSPMAYNSQDIPWLIGGWKAYDKGKIIPCLSVVIYK
jgi:hypothetical protein